MAACLPVSPDAHPRIWPVSRWVGLLPAALAALGLAVLVLGTLACVAWWAGGFSALRGAEAHAIWFTIWQAALSAGLSCLLAIPVGRALARRRFYGRNLLVSLLGAPFILPTIAAIMGLIALFGRGGWVNTMLTAAGLPSVSIYGAHGVILAHVFFNLPLATRMVLQGWQAIPAERIRLAQSLGFGAGDIQRHLEWPMLRAILPGAALAIFLVCLSSFAIALTLGGGPRATTVELAIYQAFRFDFDFGRAASLALVQVGLCLGALALASRVARSPAAFGAGHDRPALSPIGLSKWLRVQDALAITTATLFLLIPVALIVGRGIPALLHLPPDIWKACLVSLGLAVGSSLLTITLALPLAAASPRHRWAEIAAMLPLAASALVLGTGLFLMARPFINPTQLALPVTLMVNTAMSLPFVVRLLLPDMRALARDYDRLAASLGLSGLARLRYLTWPRLARPLGFGAGLSAAFSMGDLGVITLFSDGRTQTLPLALYQLMGSYRLDQAAGAATLLITLTFALFWLCDWIGHHAHSR